MIANLFLKDVPPPSERPDIDFNAMTKGELKGMVESLLNETWAIMETMSDQELTQMTKSFAGNDISRLEGMILVHDHLTNHKAKANLYVRMAGGTPPKYGYY